MIFNCIKAYFTDVNYQPDAIKACALLVRAIPYLKLIARAEAAYYFEIDETKIKQPLIQDYLLNIKQYDAVEISWIVKELNNER